MIKYTTNTSSVDIIYDHLFNCRDLFIPNLDSYVNIKEYSQKLFDKSYRFEAFDNDKLVGLICLYPNNFITNVSVLA